MENLARITSSVLAGLPPAPPADPVRGLSRDAGLPPLLARLLVARGIRTPAAAAAFFQHDPSQLFDPFLLTGVDAAADVLLSSARSGRRVVVFGDYDVDGVTAVAQLKAALVRAGAAADSFLPHRIRDGYGLKADTVRRVLAEKRPDVIVTVDCGVTAHEGVACARAAGVEVILTDHHVVSGALPDGAIVIHPGQPGCAYPYKELSGSGVAFKLAQAVAARAGVSLSREALLRAACLGTIADLVPLTGENRTIAALGLAALARPRAPGLAELLLACGIEPGVAPTSEEVAFRIAPRLNAAGRIDTADAALAVFEERDPERGRAIARELCVANAERRQLERRVFDEARERLSAGFDPDRDVLLVAGDASWHRGVLGIAASRLAREYNRPVLLFALEGDRACGSGRSVPGVPLHQTLNELRHLFMEFGGHDQAVGATVSADSFGEFRHEARELFSNRIPRERLVRRDEAEAELPLEEITEEIVAGLARFEPHGMANPRPVFSCDSVRAVAPFRPLGESGCRGRLHAGPGEIDAVAWGRISDLVAELADSRTDFGIRYRLSRSSWSGRPEVEMLDVSPARFPFSVPRFPSRA